MRSQRIVRVVWCLGASIMVSACGADSAVTPKLADASPNTWVRLTEEATGFRSHPLFYFDLTLKKFVLSGGEASRGAHADTEQFDVQAGTWANVFPSGAPYKTEHGPAETDGVDWRRTNIPLKADKNGVTRIVRGVNPYEWDPGFYQQWAFNPDDGKCYAYLLDTTLCFDGRTSEWFALKVPKFNKEHVSFQFYGTMAYDPVNKEILSIGGTSDEDGGTPGSWTFSPGGKEWKKLAQGSKELKELEQEARSLYAATAAVINAGRNRFYLTETPVEAKRDLAAETHTAATAVAKFVAKLNAAKSSGFDPNAIKAAKEMLDPVNAGLEALAGKLSGKISGETLADAQAILESLDRAALALDAEPSGRAAASAVTCYGKDKIVLFGGCRMDGYLADTWVYDCKTRTWEQRWPKVCPAPRAGHVMAWLPKSNKVVLFGAAPFSSGYGVPHGNASPPQDLWLYDLDANEWKLLAAPAKDAPLDACGAADANDQFIVVGRDPKNSHGRVTWGMKLNPDAPDAGAEKAGVKPGAVKLVFETPADYDKVSNPDSESVEKVLKDAPANQWTLMPKPPKRPNNHGWGTCPYDALRHQFLSFGGGHSAAHYNDVAHYSMRTATWSVGYGEEFPYANASFSAFFNQSFSNRPTVPTHLWDSAAFDEVSGKAVFCVRNGTWVYDPVAREWEYPPIWEKGGGTKVNMQSTPKGVVYWDVNGNLSLYDVKNHTWSKLPIKGGKLESAYCDTGGISYDSKRDCLWLGLNGSMSRYDMKSGEVTNDNVPGRPECIYMRGTAYIPELDMVLSVGRQTGTDGKTGNLAYDIENKKWIGIQFPCSDGQPRINDKPYSDINLSLVYDPELKLAIFHSNQQEILVARIDKNSIKTFEIKFQEPKKK